MKSLLVGIEDPSALNFGTEGNKQRVSLSERRRRKPSGQASLTAGKPMESASKLAQPAGKNTF
jgi:hypothetical protein